MSSHRAKIHPEMIHYRRLGAEAQPCELLIASLGYLGLCVMEPQQSRTWRLGGGRHQVGLEERKPVLVAWTQFPDLLT